MEILRKCKCSVAASLSTPCISCMAKMMVVGILITICIIDNKNVGIIKCRVATFVSSVGKQLGQLRPKYWRLGCRLLKMILLVIGTKIAAADDDDYEDQDGQKICFAVNNGLLMMAVIMIMIFSMWPI